MEDNPEEQPIHPAVELLLARMDSHPEEFEGDGKWGNRYQPFKSYWTTTEKRLVHAKLREIRMNVMHKQVMKELMK